MLVMAALLPKEITKQLMPALRSYWFYIHVSIAALAEGAFLVAVGGGVLYLVGRGQKDEAGMIPSHEFTEELIALDTDRISSLYHRGALCGGDLGPARLGIVLEMGSEGGRLARRVVVLHHDAPPGHTGAVAGGTLAALSIVGLFLILISFLGNLFFGGLHAYI